MMADYYTRALTSRDPRYRAALDRMGYGTRHMVAAEEEPEVTQDEDGPTLDDLRAEADELGIEVDNRWRERRLSEEIAKAKG